MNSLCTFVLTLQLQFIAMELEFIWKSALATHSAQPVIYHWVVHSLSILNVRVINRYHGIIVKYSKFEIKLHENSTFQPLVEFPEDLTLFL